jgi:hypothetical protein
LANSLSAWAQATKALLMSDSSEAARYVRTLYEILLQRDPTGEELELWISAMARGVSDRELFYRFTSSDEYRNKTRVRPGHPVGHYHSPIVDPEELAAMRRFRRLPTPNDIAGIDLSIERMKAWWLRNLSAIRSTPFPATTQKNYRYFHQNGVYPLGDAVLLRAMILDERPQRIVEIGSGFSSACILDTLDEAAAETKVTLIEPHPARLHSRLSPTDFSRINLIEKLVQEVPLETFKELRRGDLLIIDSSHVLKAGSDVHCELFEILPALEEGVLIHFHDVGYLFEYPDEWLFKKRYSWNEVYALRAFLMHNTKYRVEFMSTAFSGMARDVIDETYPTFAEHHNSSLWIRKVSVA